MFIFERREASEQMDIEERRKSRSSKILELSLDNHNGIDSERASDEKDREARVDKPFLDSSKYLEEHIIANLQK